MNLRQKRQAIRPLLSEGTVADATDVYYAFYHEEYRTQLVTYPPDTSPARGYVAISRTGIDLFRPLLTMRLPAAPEEAADLIYNALQPGAGVFISVPADYGPLLKAFFQVDTEQRLQVYALAAADFEPEVNVLVTRTSGLDGLPRYQVKPTSPEAEDEVAAWAGLNWQSPRFAEIAVNTRPAYRQRGWGRSVVVALSRHVLESGRTPLYVTAEQNAGSISLARSAGFRDTGVRRLLLEGTLRPRPAGL